MNQSADDSAKLLDLDGDVAGFAAELVADDV